MGRCRTLTVTLLVSLAVTLFASCTKEITSEVAYPLAYHVKEVGSGVLPMLILLHGAGADEEDLLGLVGPVSSPHRVVSFRGPFDYGFGYTWSNDRNDPTILPTVCESIAGSLPELREKYPTRGRAVALGFSYGAAVALGLGARHGEQFQHVIGVSGWLPPGMEPSRGALPASSVSLFHGRDDEIIPLVKATSAQKTLVAGGVPTQLHQHPGGHSIPPPSRAAIVEQLNTWLGAL